ncbi:superoxide dismutase [Nonomuraea sp. NPDC049152]|uniref:SMP-30/gluconolactonase/LRE family protein n=1 Tax=Nonomuraea sp. NPDC049152 TaxID=3154350 RepID=UPI0033DDD6A2
MRAAILMTTVCALLLATPAQAATRPDTIALPNGFQPEGIAIGPRHAAYFGSRATGDIYQADLRTGEGRLISKGPGTASLGIKIDHRGRLFVAGGLGGDARVVDSRTGTVLKSYPLAATPSLVNDVFLAKGAAWFTDSTNPVLYKVPADLRGDVTKLPLTGAIQYQTGINANGITTTPDRRSLLIVQSNTGKLFKVNENTGATTEVDLGGESVVNGDGLLLEGRTLYVVQNRINTLAVVRLAADGSKGRVVKRITDPRFDIPATVARDGDRLYLPNARFSTPPTPDTTYSAVAVRS